MRGKTRPHAAFPKKSAETSKRSLATLECRVLVSARLRDLKAAQEDVAIETIELVEQTRGCCRRQRMLQYYQTGIAQ